MLVLKTERLILRHFNVDDDAPFILTLLNEPSFLQYIGDKKVRTIEGARQYLSDGPLASYERHGFGLYLVELKDSNTAIGMCGLLKREELPDPDIGFAFVPEFWNRGYAFEAAGAVMNYARERLKLDRLLAIVNPDNYASIKLLERLGFEFAGMRDNGQTKLYAASER